MVTDEGLCAALCIVICIFVVAASIVWKGYRPPIRAGRKVTVSSHDLEIIHQLVRLGSKPECYNTDTVARYKEYAGWLTFNESGLCSVHFSVKHYVIEDMDPEYPIYGPVLSQEERKGKLITFHTHPKFCKIDVFSPPSFEDLRCFQTFTMKYGTRTEMVCSFDGLYFIYRSCLANSVPVLSAELGESYIALLSDVMCDGKIQEWLPKANELLKPHNLVISFTPLRSGRYQSMIFEL